MSPKNLFLGSSVGQQSRKIKYIGKQIRPQRNTEETSKLRNPNLVETSHSHDDVLKVLGAKTLEQELFERRRASWSRCDWRSNRDAIIGLGLEKSGPL